MRALLILLYILFSLNNTYAQQLFAEGGITTTTFKYKDSKGSTLTNLLPVSKGHLNTGYRFPVNRNKTVLLRLMAGYTSYGAIGSDPILDNYFEYDVNYLSGGFGIDAQIFRLREFRFLLRTSFASETLILGTQTLNNQVFDLKGNDEFNNLLFFIRAGPEGQYPISRYSKLTLHYSYGKTIGIAAQGDDEALNYNIHQFSIGILINLPSCNCSF